MDNTNNQNTNPKRKRNRNRSLKNKYDKLRKDFEELQQKVAGKPSEESAPPWVNIKGIEEDPTKGIKIDLDWNDSFVAYLKKNGMTGTTDEQVVQKWIALLYKEMLDTMNAQSNVGSEYE